MSLTPELVARCERPEPDPGPNPRFTVITPDELEALTTRLLDELVGEDLWLFAYGSLIWRPAFPYVERQTGWVEGFARRFWQASTDHRGVPEAPGRVVTLVPEPGARCWGVAFRVAADTSEAVLETLDRRDGPLRFGCQVDTIGAVDPGSDIFDALTQRGAVSR